MYELLEETLAFGFSLAFGFLVGVLIGIMLMQARALVYTKTHYGETLHETTRHDTDWGDY